MARCVDNCGYVPMFKPPVAPVSPVLKPVLHTKKTVPTPHPFKDLLDKALKKKGSIQTS